jgi:hypothetical protein
MEECAASARKRGLFKTVAWIEAQPVGP